MSYNWRKHVKPKNESYDTYETSETYGSSRREEEEEGGGGRGGGRGRGRGGGGRGRGRGRGYFESSSSSSSSNYITTTLPQQQQQQQQQQEGQQGIKSNWMTNRNDWKELERQLSQLENASYNFYKDFRNTEWQFENFILYFDRIQTDPFAPPSVLRIRIPIPATGIPWYLYQNKIRNIASCDFLTRFFAQVCRTEQYDRAEQSNNWHGNKGGDISINAPGQYVIERTSVSIVIQDSTLEENKSNSNSNNSNIKSDSAKMQNPAQGYVEVRFTCSLPGHGRKISGEHCAQVLCQNLPFVVNQSILYRKRHPDKTFINKKNEEFEIHVNSVENEEHLRRVLLPQLNAVAFIRHGSILPRRSGVSDLPMSFENAIPFMTDKKDPLYREVELPNTVPLMNWTEVKGGRYEYQIQNTKKISGLIIPKGITLIVGGGFHGKSTLLSCLEYGVYNYIPNDGREYCVCDITAVKIRAEDGRYICGVDISPFINHLPLQHKYATKSFTSEDASGSTSQAANICEALEIGTRCLLMDEDTCATNFMIRDEQMMQLVSPDKEPITPFISKIRCMYKEMDVSTILVIGGCGSYFHVADHVIMMDNYLPKNVTKKAKQIIGQMTNNKSSSSSMEIDKSDSTKGKPSSSKGMVVDNDDNDKDNDKDNDNDEPQQHNVLFQYSKFGSLSSRIPDPSSVDAVGKKDVVQLKIKEQDKMMFGWNEIDISAVSQIVERGQTSAIGYCLVYLQQQYMQSKRMNIQQLMKQLQIDLDRKGLDVLSNVDATARYHGELSPHLVRPRIAEVGAALNRLRTLKLLKQ